MNPNQHNLLPQLPAEAVYLRTPKLVPGNLRCAVVVPARNEAKRILACLEAVRCQWSAAGRTLNAETVTVLVINGTTDSSAYQVMQWMAAHPEVAIVLIDANFPPERAHVGSARGLGLDVAAELLRRYGRGTARRQLLFSTDADSRLAHDSLQRGLDELTRAQAFGAHIVAGEEDTSRIGLTVNRYNALKGQLRHRLYPNPFDRHAPHGTFGGAGFGVSRHAFEAVGGLPELAFDEDQMMRRRLLDAGFGVSYPRDIVVYTSTRLTGRTPWGMAKQLAAWEREEASRWPTVPTAAGLVAKYTLKQRLRTAFAKTEQPETFEQYWSAYWRNPWVQSQHAHHYPERDVRTAITELTVELGLRGAPAQLPVSTLATHPQAAVLQVSA